MVPVELRIARVTIDRPRSDEARTAAATTSPDEIAIHFHDIVQLFLPVF